MKRWWIALLVVIALGCKPEGPAKFFPGDTAVVAITGEKVMVVRAWYPEGNVKKQRWLYTCRVSGTGQQRRDGIVSADTKIIAYPLVNFFGFELREEVEK